MNACAAFFLGAATGALGAAIGTGYVASRRAARNGRLLSFALHEINTPVTAVNMTLINLVSAVFGPVPPEQLRWLEMSRDQVARLGSVVGEVRDLVHLEFSRDLQSSPESFAAGSLIASVVEAVRGGFKAASVELVVSAECVGDVYCDKDRAARAVESLLYHARKFRISGPVALGATLENGFYRVEISYQGPPMSAVDAQDSLDVYFPANIRRNHVLSSSGMGLGLIRRVAQLDGGDLDFRVDAKGVSRLLLTWRGADAA